MTKKQIKKTKTTPVRTNRSKPTPARRASPVSRAKKTTRVATRRKKPVAASCRVPKPTFKQRLGRALKQLLIPNKANQYRPHLIRRYGIAVLLLLAMGIPAGYNMTTTGSVLGSQSNITAMALLTDTNLSRQEHDLKPLKIDERLTVAATDKAQDMLEHQYWAHTAPDGTTPWHWFDKAGYEYSYAGENLAKNFNTADSATTAWMASPDHRANILDQNYSDVGFATVRGELNGKPTTLTIALYGKPQGPTAGAVAVAGTRHQADSMKGAVEAPASQSISLVTRFGMAMQAITPAALGSLALLTIAAFVAFIAHLFRKKQPAARRKSWYKYHGLIKFGGLGMLCLMVLALYSGGQI